MYLLLLRSAGVYDLSPLDRVFHGFLLQPLNSRSSLPSLCWSSPFSFHRHWQFLSIFRWSFTFLNVAIPAKPDMSQMSFYLINSSCLSHFLFLSCSISLMFIARLIISSSQFVSGRDLRFSSVPTSPLRAQRLDRPPCCRGDRG